MSTVTEPPRQDVVLLRLEALSLITDMEAAARCIGDDIIKSTGELPDEKQDWIFELLDYCRQAEEELQEPGVAL